jgi:2,3-bisphosphoglycerate-independent phosphoglycerate mutase
MKYIILLGDGMADYPLDVLDGKTPLEYADTPHMDRIAREGTLGMVDTVPYGFPPGSDVAIMSLMGYDPRKYYTGRGPLEAASMGVSLEKDDVAFRCNLVTFSGTERLFMEDFTSGHITSQESRLMMNDLQKAIGTEQFRFYPGVSYRNLFVWKGGKSSMKTTPPHDITGEAIKDYLPEGDGADQLRLLMELSQEILKDHPVNEKRLSQGEKPASSIWLWGQGRAPNFVKLVERYGIRGGMISAVDLLNGIGIYAGLEVIRIKGATGYTDTNYLGKAQGALEALKERDFIFVHVEAPDEMGHEGDIEGKVKAIEDFDKKVVGTIMEERHQLSPFRLMVLSDHPTPISIRTHSSDPSPFAVLSSLEGENVHSRLSFCEQSAKKSMITISPGYLLMDAFIGDWRRFIEEKSH